MCMILYHRPGKDFPTIEELNLLVKLNPHGFGLWTHSKVYKTLDPERVIDLIYSLSENEEFVFHCRLATHGSVRRRNCHPFFDGDGDFFFHNGVFAVHPEKDHTDSEYVFRHYISGQRLKKLPDSVVNGSRILLVRKGVPFFYGQWWEDDRGLVWSKPFGTCQAITFTSFGNFPSISLEELKKSCKK